MSLWMFSRIPEFLDSLFQEELGGIHISLSFFVQGMVFRIIFLYGILFDVVEIYTALLRHFIEHFQSFPVLFLVNLLLVTKIDFEGTALLGHLFQYATGALYALLTFP